MWGLTKRSGCGILGVAGGPMRHTTLMPRLESVQEYSDGRFDWRTAHTSAGEGTVATRFIPETCARCWKIQKDWEATQEFPGAATLDERLAEEGLRRG